MANLKWAIVYLALWCCAIGKAHAADGATIAAEYYSCLGEYDAVRGEISDTVQRITDARARKGKPFLAWLADVPGNIYGRPFYIKLGYTDECRAHIGYARSTLEQLNALLVEESK